MGTTNACFISYRHSLNKDASEIVNQFYKALAGQIAMYLPNDKVYLDTDRLRGGDFFNQELAVQLCKSSCMVLLYNPRYFDLEHPYCAREYKAMLQLERQRLEQAQNLQNKGLIIPVVIRGENGIPREIKQNRQFFSLESVLLHARDFRTKRCLEKIREIAQQVYVRHNSLSAVIKSSSDQCNEFCFPKTEEIYDWLNHLVNAQPSQPMPCS